MPRAKTLPDADILAAALELLRAKGPDALTFAALSKACGLSASTLVQRFHTKGELVQTTLLQAWNELDERTAAAAAMAPRSPGGAIELLTLLSRHGPVRPPDGPTEPALQARAGAWKETLVDALDACFAEAPSAPPQIGQLLADQWQGALAWWALDPRGDVESFVQDSLTDFVRAVLDRAEA